jgi:hypothetical protein
MAFGKKKGEDQIAMASTPDDEDDGPLFPDEEPEADATEAPVAVAAPDAPVAVTPAPADAAAPGTDALLSAFQTTEGGDEDRSVLLDMAGDVELADLLEELNTLAAAMGLSRA